LPPYSLCEHETIGEVVAVINRRSSCLPDELVNKPIEVLLKHTFALDSMLRENSIQTRFGGVGLITTIEDLNEVITNDGNLASIKKHRAFVGFRIISDSSVVFLPVLIVRNGGVHFAFDLTHEVWSFEL